MLLFDYKDESYPIFCLLYFDLQLFVLNDFLLQKMLNGPRTLVGYVDSSVVQTGSGVYEVLLLMTYCKRHLLHLMNEK